MPVPNSLSYPTDAELRNIAIKRNRQKDHLPGTYNLTAGHRYIGLVGERSAAEMLGVEMDLVQRRGGNKRANLIAGDFLIDVVTRQPRKSGGMPDLIVNNPTESVRVDLVMLMLYRSSSNRYDERSEAAFVGWVWHHELISLGRPKQFREDGALCRIVSLSDLHQPDELFAVITKGKPEPPMQNLRLF